MYMYMLFLKLNAHYSSAVKLRKGVIFKIKVPGWELHKKNTSQKHNVFNKAKLCCGFGMYFNCYSAICENTAAVTW